MAHRLGRPGAAGAGLYLALAALALPSTAWANGAFPDEFSIHFPASAPHRILVGANFGLLVTEDDGATWRYACEPWICEGSSAALGQYNVAFYQLTADDVILAQSKNVVRSEDDACTWPISTGAISGQVVTDLFADPNDATFVLAIVVTATGSSVLPSYDGGKTFVEPPLYETSELLTGIEISRTLPRVIYAASVPQSGTGATLLRSDDSGMTWNPTPITIPTGTEPLIAAIDPADANTVYFRVVGALTDSIWITTNAGQDFDTSLTINGQFNAFLRATDGTLYAGELAGVLHVRAPGATSWTSHSAPHFRCLGQRTGTSRIFACGDMGIDGFSVGYSDDGGATFHPMMSFTDLLGLLTCPAVADNCQAHWQRIQGVLGITPTDGGTGGGPPDAGPADAGQPDAGGTTPPPPPPPGQKSGCDSTGGNAVTILGLIVVLLLWRRRS
jgi:photosystem II stability/assembly factor-like uncharacterized protein